MDNNIQNILRRVTQNDPSLTTLILDNNNIYGDDSFMFYSDNGDDYSALGAAIANNTHLAKLEFTLSDDLPLTVANRAFYDGLKSNSSIHELILYCRSLNIAGGVAHEILKIYQENNNHLTVLRIYDADLQSGGDRVIVDTLRNCRNLQSLDLTGCDITDAQLLPMVEAVRRHHLLESLDVGSNDIGNAGCEAIATLLIDPNCNLRILNLAGNAINNEGATTIANSLTNNNQLQKLYLYRNPIDQSVEDVFSNILYNTSNINNTYSSNHTLKALVFGCGHGHSHGQHLASLLSMNTHTNKSHVAIKKILKFHPNIDMEPLFDWDAEEGEQNLKALPYVINWFGRAREAIVDEDEEEYNNIEGRKLSAIFQFAKAMPLLLEGISHINAVNEKRKRED